MHKSGITASRTDKRMSTGLNPSEAVHARAVHSIIFSVWSTLLQGRAAASRPREVEDEQSSGNSRQSFYGSARVMEPETGERPPVLRCAFENMPVRGRWKERMLA